MCIICDGASPEEARRRLATLVRRYGWAIQGVEAGPRSAPWAYTIGLSEMFGHPELVIAGAEVEAAAAGLNELAERVGSGERFEAGRRGILLLGAKVDVVPIEPVHLRRGLLAAWEDYYADLESVRPRLEAVQVVLPPEVLSVVGSGGQPHLDQCRSGLTIAGPNRAERRAVRHGRRG
jgi:hypothetical protein